MPASIRKQIGFRHAPGIAVIPPEKPELPESFAGQRVAQLYLRSRNQSASALGKGCPYKTDFSDQRRRQKIIGLGSNYRLPPSPPRPLPKKVRRPSYAIGIARPAVTQL